MMKSGGGSVVFNGSAIAHKGYANHDVMAAAKGAIAGMVGCLPESNPPDHRQMRR